MALILQLFSNLYRHQALIRALAVCHGWGSEVHQLVADWQALYFRDVEAYAVMAKAFEQEHPFPHDVFEFWRVTDGLPVEV